MNDEKTAPEWLRRARACWPKNTAPKGLDATWSPYWMKRFIEYLKRRNDGGIPGEAPEYAITSSFCRFLRTKWKTEEWKIDQARVAVEWLLNAGRGGLEAVKRLFEQDMAGGRPGVFLPHQLDRKYPNAGREWWEAEGGSSTGSPRGSSDGGDRDGGIEIVDSFALGLSRLGVGLKPDLR